MRLPFPERLQIWPVFGFAASLCIAQLMLGTTLLFSFCTLVFVMLATFAFNVTGGFTRATGGFVVGYAVIGVLSGLVYKVVAGEPGQKNLLQPERTMEVFVAGIVAVLAAAMLERRLAFKRPLYDRLPLHRDIAQTATTCMLIGVFFQIDQLTGGASQSGSLLALARQFNIFFPLAVLLGTTAEIRRSGGKRSVNLTVALSMIGILTGGIFYFSKQGLFSPFICWLIAAAAQRYKVSVLQVGTLLAGAFLANYYLVPYSQYGRDLLTEETSFSTHLQINMALLSHLDLVRKAYESSSSAQIEERIANHYYDRPAGVFDRLQMISPDDALIDITEGGSVFGFLPTLIDFENVVPHFILPNKPAANFGNIYAHEAGIVGEDDNTTGISFTPSGDAYHQGQWVGVLLLLPALVFMLFWITNAVLGDVRNSPIGLVVIFAFLHVAPEGGIGGILGMTFTNNVIMIVVGLLLAYLIPLASGLLPGFRKRQAQVPAAPDAAQVLGANV